MTPVEARYVDDPGYRGRVTPVSYGNRKELLWKHPGDQDYHSLLNTEGMETGKGDVFKVDGFAEALFTQIYPKPDTTVYVSSTPSENGGGGTFQIDRTGMLVTIAVGETILLPSDENPILELTGI